MAKIRRTVRPSFANAQEAPQQSDDGSSVNHAGNTHNQQQAPHEEEESIKTVSGGSSSSSSSSATGDDQQNNMISEESEGGGDGEDEPSNKRSKNKKEKSSSNENNKEEDNKNDDNDDDEDDEDDKSENSNQMTSKSSQNKRQSFKGISRLFAPYRSIGIVSSGRPFYTIPHQSSQSAMICVPIGERFQLFQTDSLRPVMVSQAVCSNASTNNSLISHIISDPTLSISVVAHGSTPTYHSHTVTLFQRTRPMALKRIISKKDCNEDWNIVDLMHLGLIKVQGNGEKEGKSENAAIVVVILSKGNSNDGQQGVQIVGNDDDDDDSSSSSSGSSSSSSDDSSDDEEDDQEIADANDPSKECHGQVVVLVATRTSLKIQKRIYLTDKPTFVPTVATHPSTYLNKIVIGGFSGDAAKTGDNDNNNKDNNMLLLLNIRSGKLIHAFSCIKCNQNKKNKKDRVTTLEQTPAIDTIAVGTNTGKVHMINLKQDVLLFTLYHKKSNGKGIPITSLSFQTDGSCRHYGIAPMAVGRADGTITIWDLTPNEDDNEEVKGSGGRTILTEMEHLYPGGVAKLEYMPQEPLLISSGIQSNSISMHLFDNPDHSGRLLRFRKGHTSPPKCIQYLHPGNNAILASMADGTSAEASQILSTGGQDRTLRIFSTVRSVLDRELSQGPGLAKKAKRLGIQKEELLLPPATQIVSCEARSRDWGDLVTIHQNHPFAYVWNSKQGSQSGPILRQDDWNVSTMKAQPHPKYHATSVAISACGNFALIGTKGGTIFKYNIQSGNPRGSYPSGAYDNANNSKKGKHLPGNIQRTMTVMEKNMKISNRPSNIDKAEQDAILNAQAEKRLNAKLQLATHYGYAITGISVDSINKTVISVGGDSKLIMWHFTTHAPHKKSPYILPAPATKLCHIRESDLAAIALSDYTVVLFDCSTLSIVRRFGRTGTSTLSSPSLCHTGPISDIGFSPDGRMLFTSSLDGTIRVWDVPTNTCIDWLGFRSPPTSLTVSPTGEYLATTHAGKLGISLWSDRSFYQTVDVDLSAPLQTPARIDDPVPLAESNDATTNRDYLSTLNENSELEIQNKDTKDGDDDDDDDELVKGGTAQPVEAKENGLVTMSGLPPAHWKNLFRLDLVKERNKPTEAPKKPESAPFFLQWRAGESMTPDEPGPVAETNKKEETIKDGTPMVEEENWEQAWSDDDDDDNNNNENHGSEKGKRDRNDTDGDLDTPNDNDFDNPIVARKRRKILARSKLADLLQECGTTTTNKKRQQQQQQQQQFQRVTDYIATLGPSAIDIELSSLCHGIHDLEEGVMFLNLACLWFLEACESRERYEAVNAYLHRFLDLHATLLAGIDTSLSNENEQTKYNDNTKSTHTVVDNSCVAEKKKLMTAIAALQKAQSCATECLNGKIQNTLCLLKHLSRMV